MKALIVEDERMAQMQLIRLLKTNFPNIEIVGTEESVRSTIQYLENNPQPDIIFMDVELSDGDCFEIFRHTGVSAKVIMTTAYDAYAIKAFETGTVDYLLKPIELSSLRRAIDRCASRSDGIDVEKLLAALRNGAQKQYRERSSVRSGDTIIPIAADNIAFFYSEDKANYLTTDEGKTYIIESTLDLLEQELNPTKFFRISRSCIINRTAIKSASRHMGGRLVITPAQKAPIEMGVSRARTEDFLAWLDS